MSMMIYVSIYGLMQDGRTAYDIAKKQEIKDIITNATKVGQINIVMLGFI